MAITIIYHNSKLDQNHMIFFCFFVNHELLVYLKYFCCLFFFLYFVKLYCWKLGRYLLATRFWNFAGKYSFNLYKKIFDLGKIMMIVALEYMDKVKAT